MSRTRPPSDLLAYLRLLAGEDPCQPERYLDVRWSTERYGMRRQFIPSQRANDAAWLILGLAFASDVYVGVALRDCRHNGGGRSAISGSHLLYIECDDTDARGRLARYHRRPSMVIASGSPGHLHIYWRLNQRANSALVESANRRLALALHGDPASTDIARVLRPPSSLNHKHDPPEPVRLLQHNNARYELCELTDSLPADPHPGNARRPVRLSSAERTALDRDLLAIPATEYVRVLAGREPNSKGKVLCPFHHETTPSLQLYPDGTFYCFGRNCHKGGTIFDFAAAIWNTRARGKDFIELRRRLASTFALTATPVKGAR